MASSGAKLVDIEAQAAVWATKLDAAPDRDHPGLDEWFAEDPRHAGALLRAQALLAAFTPPASNPVTQTDEAAPRRPRWPRRALLGGGVSAVAASLAAFLLLAPRHESYETQIGEVRSLALGDGSSVSIDAKSRIDLDFDGRNRDVHMLAGKVLFRATHDRKRPFRVLLDNVTVTDIGTAFQITKDERTQTVDVLVTEGEVRVDSPAGRISLVAGQRASFSQIASSKAKPQVTPVAATDMDRYLAWRNGQLDLDGETLDSAIAQFNRHSLVQLKVSDAALGRENLYGSFRMDDPATFARTVALGLNAEVRTVDGVIEIGSRKK